MFYRFTTAATQKRLESYDDHKSHYRPVHGVTFYGAFDTIDPAASINMGLSGQGYIYTTDGDADIKANDILIIDNNEYRVKGVRRNTQGGIDILIAVLVLPVKA